MEEDRKLRLFAVDSYVSLLQEEPDKLPQRFLQVISWVSRHNEHCKNNLHNSFVIVMRKRSRRGKMNTRFGLKHALPMTKPTASQFAEEGK